VGIDGMCESAHEADTLPSASRRKSKEAERPSPTAARYCAFFSSAA
jgi:hypothetical protein